ncbi:MAG: diguanylate cyclase [Candidatus Omnitrophica bacterium]|nr:diguanylate cyclase [Candidatus Omnitrophota bacterium]
MANDPNAVISDADYRSIFDKANDGIFIHDINTFKVTDANQRGCEMFCYPQDEILRLNAEELFPGPPPYTRKNILSFFEKASRGDQQLFEWASKDKAGRPFWIEVNLRRSLIGPKYRLLAVVRDITERKYIEERLKDVELRFRKALFYSPFPVMIYSEDGKVLLLNKAWTESTGYSREDIPTVSAWAGKTCGERMRPVKVDINRLYKLDERVKEGEYIVTAKDGGKRIWDMSSAPFGTLPNGKRMVLSMATDITERKEAEKKILELNTELVRSNALLKQLTVKDSHTGLYNHRYLEEAIEREFSRAKRQDSPLSVIMMDIDYFKSINDAYGHQFGDLVLRQFAAQLTKAVRRYDIVIRFGGEEFIVISPGTGAAGAMTLAKRILSVVNAYDFGNKKHRIKMKLSIAVISYPDDRVTKAMDLVDMADKALGKAKEEGGNMVFSPEDMGAERPRATEGALKGAADVKAMKEKLDKLTKRVKQSLFESIFAFAKTIELKDHYTGEHAEKMAGYAAEIARMMHLAPEQIEHIRQASILHDLGKIGISDKILHKKSKLTKKEFEEIRAHPQIAVDILRPIHFMSDIIPLILHHHERWDGKGYPTGLKGQEIPIGARIIAIADVYQALTSVRPYHEAYPKKDAIKILKKGAGTQFDPNIVNIFLRILKRESHRKNPKT